MDTGLLNGSPPEPPARAARSLRASAGAAGATGRPGGAAAGFSLIEALVAMVILSFVIVSTQAMITSRFVSDVGAQEGRIVAVQLVADRLQAVQQDPSYASLQARYAGTETDLPGHPGFTRTTQVVHTLTDQGLDFKRITVTVTGPGVSRPVARTATVAAP